MMRPRRPAISPSAIFPSYIFGGRASPVIALEGKGGVGSPETETVRNHHIERHIIATPAHDRNVGEIGIELFDIGAFADETVLHHEDRIDRFLDPGGTQGMAG